ncbi:hypothetical protein AAFN60_01870 [Roseibacillus persicicus]|uniref:hypothetical protein n=1 Tax=Roseibacillus persicicus TaxID=454148 RepID=UPI00398BAF2E
MTATKKNIGDPARLNRKGHPWHRHNVIVTAHFGDGYVVVLRKEKELHKKLGREGELTSISVGGKELV